MLRWLPHGANVCMRLASLPERKYFTSTPAMASLNGLRVRLMGNTVSFMRAP